MVMVDVNHVLLDSIKLGQEMKCAHLVVGERSPNKKVLFSRASAVSITLLYANRKLQQAESVL